MRPLHNHHRIAVGILADGQASPLSPQLALARPLSTTRNRKREVLSTSLRLPATVALAELAPFLTSERSNGRDRLCGKHSILHTSQEASA